jgi:hypothetical protein
MSNVFVNHDEKKALIVERPDIIDHTDPNNPWDEVIDKFVKLIGENTKNDIVSSLK